MRKIILMGEPYHGNIGDQAIYYAEEKFIKTYFPNFEYYHVHEDKLDICVKKMKNMINTDDIIMIHGGGNLGNIYARPERGRREVIKTFPNNKIILFPETAYFTPDEEGAKELEISKEIYNKHSNLVILAREKLSYDFIKKHFTRARVYLTPDIVMTLKIKSNYDRNGALVLFRGDKESIISSETKCEILNLVKKNYDNYFITDMNLETINKESKIYLKNKFSKYGLFKNSIDDDINCLGGELREKILEYKFDEFEKSEVVITDRLHGMIFSAITETPCIVFKSLDNKITESYKAWLSKFDYIKYLSDTSKVGETIKELKSLKKVEYDNEFAINSILDVLKEEIN